MIRSGDVQSGLEDVHYLTRRDPHGLMPHIAFNSILCMKGNLYGYSNFHGNVRHAQHTD